MCMLGNLPFFFIIMVMESNATLIAIINNVYNKVLNISIIFVLMFLYCEDCVGRLCNGTALKVTT